MTPEKSELQKQGEKMILDLGRGFLQMKAKMTEPEFLRWLEKTGHDPEVAEAAMKAAQRADAESAP